MRANDRDGVNLSRIERQHGVLVLEQNDALLLDLPRNRKPGEWIDHTALAGMIDHAGGEHGAQDAVYMLVQFSHRNLACLNRGLVGLAEENRARLFIIESGR